MTEKGVSFRYGVRPFFPRSGLRSPPHKHPRCIRNAGSYVYIAEITDRT